MKVVLKDGTTLTNVKNAGTTASGGLKVTFKDGRTKTYGKDEWKSMSHGI